MPKVCFYFLLHQPYRLCDYSVLDLGSHHSYFWQKNYNQNKEVFLKVADKSYRPMLKLLLSLSKTYPNFKFAFSTSGVFLEQAQMWAPDIIKILRRLAKRKNQVEVLGENYYHSLASLYSPVEFAQPKFFKFACSFLNFKKTKSASLNGEQMIASFLLGRKKSSSFV